MTVPDPQGQKRLGVPEALGKGWALLTSDFWPFWVLGLVAFLLMQAVNLPGVVPYIGGCFAIVLGVFVQPPLQAGLVYAVARRIDGAPPDVGDLFQGFQQRYWASVVAMLPFWGIGVAIALAVGFLAAASFGTAFALSRHQPGETVALVAAAAMAVLVIPLVLLVIVAALFFTFSFVALWEPHGSGWEAILTSVRIVRGHFWSTLAFALMAMGIGLGAALAGLLTCCVGLAFTTPVAMLWLNATLIYLYRAWRS